MESHELEENAQALGDSCMERAAEAWTGHAEDPALRVQVAQLYATCQLAENQAHLAKAQERTADALEGLLTLARAEATTNQE